MKRTTRWIFVFILLAGLLPLGAAPAQAQSTVDCATVAASLKAKYDEGVLDGAAFCIIYPPTKTWNRDMVVFAHGYVFDNPLNPLQAPEIPWDQAIRGDLNLPAILINLGYAFAITSYHKDGLAVLEGVQDVVALANYIKDANRKVKHVFLTGVSEGGLVTTLAVQDYPQVFTAGLATCGPIGSFQGQVLYWGDFRSVFDTLYPAVLKVPGLSFDPTASAVNIPLPLRLAWMAENVPDPFRPGEFTSALKLSVLQALMADPASTQLLLAATGAPVDPANLEASVAQTVLGILDYNLQATNEGKLELGGNPYFNSGVVNGIPVDLITPDAAALAEIAAHYETSGKLSRPLVIMHTTGDPIVPFWHATAYLKKAFMNGSLLKTAFIPVVGYGHCAFTPAQAVFAFSVMVVRAGLQPFSASQIQRALPDAQSREEFKLLQEKGTAE